MTEPRGGTPRAGRLDNLRFAVSQTLPQLLRGMFTRRPRLSSLLDRWHPDPLGVRLVSELRARHRSDFVWLDLLGKPSLLVLDVEGVRRVLDESPGIYGPPAIKLRGMAHFQPEALTVSTGDDWRRRRAFHEDVLSAGLPGGAGARDLLAAVHTAVASALDRGAVTLGWPTLHGLFERITACVVFGSGVESASVLAELDALMRRANRIVGDGDTPERRAFLESIRVRIHDPRAGGLAAAACPHATAGDPLPVAGQLPHWLFAMKDTLAINCVNALALIAAHPAARARARAEAAEADLADPAAVQGMTYLEGCLRDAMRLWPTTPMIVREARVDDEICGHAVPAGAQVIIHNGFHHRSAAAMPDPDSFHPEAWRPDEWSYRFNPMSNGAQACAGRELALHVGKAVLGSVLAVREWRLEGPRLDPARPLPHAFDHQAVVLRGMPA